MLYEAVCRALDAGALKGIDSYRPFPAMEERGAWAKLAPEARGYFEGRAESEAARDWPVLPAVRYMDFCRNGNRRNYEKEYFARRVRLTLLALATCARGSDEWLDALTNGVWAVCEETSWVLPAHNWRRGTDGETADLELPDLASPVYIDLFSAATGATLAVLLRLVGGALEKASPLIPARVRMELKRRILDPFLESDDMWWMGFGAKNPNNWNPWIVSNVLTAALLVEDDPARRDALCKKAARCADNFLAGYAPDGGCDEGPSYFSVAGASLLDVLELFDGATGGAVDLYGEPLIRNMAQFAYHAHIAGDRFVNFADAPFRVGNTPAGLLARVARRMEMPDLEGFAERMRAIGRPAWAVEEGRANCAFRLVRDILEYEPPREDAPVFASASHFYPGIQVAVARERENDERGLFFAAKGGTNGESHNHNDVGSYILCEDGEPVLLDAGVGEYTRKTFSPERYDIWSMNARHHNTALLNGLCQTEGKAYAARDARFSDDGNAVSFSLELAGAYPEAAGCLSLRRSFVFDRAARTLTVTDALRLREAAQPAELPLMLPDEPVLSPGTALLARGVRLLYDAEGFEARAEAVELTDARMRAAWGRDRLWKLSLRRRAPETQAEWTLTFVKA